MDGEVRDALGEDNRGSRLAFVEREAACGTGPQRRAEKRLVPSAGSWTPLQGASEQGPRGGGEQFGGTSGWRMCWMMLGLRAKSPEK